MKELAETLGSRLFNVVQENTGNKVEGVEGEFEDIEEETVEMMIELSRSVDNMLSEKKLEEYDILKRLKNDRNVKQEARWKQVQVERTKPQGQALAKRRRQNWTEADEEKQRQVETKYYAGNSSLAVSSPSPQQIGANVAEENTGKKALEEVDEDLAKTFNEVETDQNIVVEDDKCKKVEPGIINAAASLFLEPCEPKTGLEDILQSDPLTIPGLRLEEQVQIITNGISSEKDFCWLTEAEEEERKGLKSVNLARKRTDQEQTRWLCLQEKRKRRQIDERKRKSTESLNQEQLDTLRQQRSNRSKEKRKLARQYLDMLEENMVKQESSEIFATENINTFVPLAEDIEHPNIKSEPITDDLLTYLMHVSDVGLNEKQVGNMFRDKDGIEAVIKNEHEFRKFKWLPENEESEWKELKWKKRNSHEQERWLFLQNKKRLEQAKTWKRMKYATITPEQRAKEAERTRRRRASLSKEQLDAKRRKDGELKKMSRHKQQQQQFIMTYS